MQQVGDGVLDGAGWHQREVSRALLRLANARANVAVLEAQATGGHVVENRLSKTDADAIERMHAQIERMRPHAAGPFGGRTVRQRLVELQTEQYNRFQRLGVDSYEHYRAVLAAQERRQIDLVALEVARREAQSAEQAFLEIADLPVPERPALEAGPSGGYQSVRFDATADDDEVIDLDDRVIDLSAADRRSAAS